MEKFKNRITVLAAVMLCIVLCTAYAVMPAGAADAPSAVLPVNQEILSEDNPDAVEFTYELRAITPGAPLPDGASGNVFTFVISGRTGRNIVIEYPQALSHIYPDMAQFEYTVRCTGCSSEDYVIDSSQYPVRAYACINVEEEAVASILVYSPDDPRCEGEKVSSAQFTHRKKDGGPDPIVVVDPPVQKRITGTPANRDEFRFRLRAEESGNPMPEGSVNGEKTVSIFGAGTEEFGTWAYTAVGTYNYDISEVNMNDPDYEYDTRMFTITDVVTLNGNEFNVNRTIVDSSGRVVDRTIITPSSRNERAASLEFVNRYKGGGSGGGKTDPAGKPSERSRGVQTGDSGMPYLWIVVIAAAAVALFIVLFRNRRKSR